MRPFVQSRPCSSSRSRLVAGALLSVGLLAAHVLATEAEPPKAGTGLDPDQLKLIHPRLQELVDKEIIPGAVALVARHGEVAYLDAVGYQNWEKKTPMRTDSIFQIMSMTKPFTGVAIMMLVEEGKLELRRPVSDYLPEFKDQEVEEVSFNNQMTLHKPANPPTVWQLMCHTSGLNGDPEGELSDNPRTMRATLAEAVNYYGHQHLKFEPGTHWRYSNMGIATLGRLIEVVSGEEYVHFIQTRLLTPLGMNDTFFFAPNDKKDRIAMVYKHQGGKLVISGSEILAGDPTKYREGAKISGARIWALLHRAGPGEVLRHDSEGRHDQRTPLRFKADHRHDAHGVHAGRDSLRLVGRHRLRSHV